MTGRIYQRPCNNLNRHIPLQNKEHISSRLFRQAQGGLQKPLTMNAAVFAFRRYENASLAYTGIDSHEGLTQIGGYDTVVAA